MGVIEPFASPFHGLATRKEPSRKCCPPTWIPPWFVLPRVKLDAVRLHPLATVSQTSKAFQLFLRTGSFRLVQHLF